MLVDITCKLTLCDVRIYTDMKNKFHIQVLDLFPDSHAWMESLGMRLLSARAWIQG